MLNFHNRDPWNLSLLLPLLPLRKKIHDIWKKKKKKSTTSTMGKTPQSPSSFSPSEIKSMTSEKKKNPHQPQSAKHWKQKIKTLNQRSSNELTNQHSKWRTHKLRRWNPRTQAQTEPTNMWFLRRRSFSFVFLFFICAN